MPKVRAAEIEVRQRRLAVDILEHEADIAGECPAPLVHPAHGMLTLRAGEIGLDHLLAAALGVESNLDRPFDQTCSRPGTIASRVFVVEGRAR